VRPYVTEAKMHKIIAESAARAAAGPDALERELDRMMEADFCRHAYVTSDILMPVVENFFCPCCFLACFEFLDQAERTPHALATLV